MSDFNKVLPLMPAENIHFLCIGTDRSTGDALGPLVGSRLESLGFNVTGTIDDPCHAVNLGERSAEIPKERTVIAVDACLGKSSNVGRIRVTRGPLLPGAGVGKNLGSYGDYHITAIVNVGGFMEYFVLQNTRLSFILSLANEIVNGICSVYQPAAFLVAVGLEEVESE